MERIVKLSLVLSILFLFSSQAVASGSYFSSSGSYFSRSGEKFVSGIANVATGFMELPKNVILTSQNEGPLYGITVGLATGLMHTVGRTVIGALDVVTFLVPTKPSVQPPFIWQDFSRETTY